MLEVAARMIEETPGVTRLLDRLEAKPTSVGNVVPAIVGSTCAGSRVKGHVLLDSLKSAMSAGHERVLERLDLGDRQRLMALLDVIGSEE